MKLRNKIAAITGAATLAFAGIGFAAWTFTKSVNNNDADVTGQVTAAIEAEGLAVEDGSGNAVAGLYLICDAPTSAELSAASVTGLLPSQGIYWSTQADGSDVITQLTLIGSVNEEDNDIADISTYDGHFASTATGAVAGSWVNIAATSALDATVTSTTASADVEYVWTLPAVSYADSTESVAEVDLLEAEVDGLSLTFAFSFNVAAIN